MTQFFKHHSSVHVLTIYLPTLSFPKSHLTPIPRLNASIPVFSSAKRRNPVAHFTPLGADYMRIPPGLKLQPGFLDIFLWWGVCNYMMKVQGRLKFPARPSRLKRPKLSQPNFQPGLGHAHWLCFHCTTFSCKFSRSCNFNYCALAEIRYKIAAISRLIK